MSDIEIKLTSSQGNALDKMKDFVCNSSDRFFILKGYAGTGKTTLMRYLIQHLENQKIPYKLLSTTGRAAKVLSDHTGHIATTIHGMVYTYSSFNKDTEIFDNQTNIDEVGQLILVFEPTQLKDDSDKDGKMVYIVDESSMISDVEDHAVSQAKFGSGRLLKELVDYDRRKNSKFIFVGDPCQLPPIKDIASPALDKAHLEKTFGATVQEVALTEIMRQNNSIAFAGNMIRKLWQSAPSLESDYKTINSSYNTKPTWGQPIHFSKYEDIIIHRDLAEMENLYIANVNRFGYTDSIFITSSNKNCKEISEHLRGQLGFSGVVQKKDLLMVIQNQMTTCLMNGDMVEVIEVGNRTERSSKLANGYSTQLAFREVRVRELVNDREFTTLLIEDVLVNNLGNLDSRQQSGLFLDFILRMKRIGITEKKKDQFSEAMRKDPYLNALRCTYGYAVTCHKAQGGEWNNAFIQLPRNITRNPTKGKYQWLYTAITRAKDKVHIANDFFIR